MYSNSLLNPLKEVDIYKLHIEGVIATLLELLFKKNLLILNLARRTSYCVQALEILARCTRITSQQFSMHC